MKEKLYDEELIIMMKEGNTEAKNIFYQRYYRYSKNIAFQYYYSNRHKGINYDDLVSIAFEMTYQILTKYYDEQPASFYPYWRKACENEIIRFIKSYVQTPSVDNHSEKLEKGNRDFATYDSYVSILEEEIFNILNEDKTKYGLEMKRIFLLYLNGVSISQIVKETGIKRETVKYRLKTIREKLQKFMKIPTDKA